MKYKAVWQVVGALCFIGLVMVLIGFVVGGLFGAGIAAVGVALCAGGIAGGYGGHGGLLVGWVVGAFVGGAVGVKVGGVVGRLGVFVGAFVGLLVGGAVGVKVGVWSDKKKNEIDERLEFAHKKGRVRFTESTPTHKDGFGSTLETNKIKPSKPQTESKNVEAETKSYAEIKKEINRLQKEEKMIDVRAIESALENRNPERADFLLGELKERYEEYKSTIERLKKLDDRRGNLAEQLADRDLDRDTFNKAIDGIEGKKHDLEEKLNRLRREVIYEDYEKPF